MGSRGGAEGSDLKARDPDRSIESAQGAKIADVPGADMFAPFDIVPLAGRGQVAGGARASLSGSSLSLRRVMTALRPHCVMAVIMGPLGYRPSRTNKSIRRPYRSVRPRTHRRAAVSSPSSVVA